MTHRIDGFDGTLSSVHPVQSVIPPVFRLQHLKSHDLHEITIQKLQLLLSNLDFSSTEYVRFCLERVRKVSSFHITAVS